MSPKVTLPTNIHACPHQYQHPIWIGRGGRPVPVCLMQPNYLRNCIKLLEQSIQECYQTLGAQPPSSGQLLTQPTISEDEHKLRMLKSELKRRYV